MGHRKTIEATLDFRGDGWLAVSYWDADENVSYHGILMGAGKRGDVPSFVKPEQMDEWKRMLEEEKKATEDAERRPVPDELADTQLSSSALRTTSNLNRTRSRGRIWQRPLRLRPSTSRSICARCQQTIGTVMERASKRKMEMNQETSAAKAQASAPKKQKSSGESVPTSSSSHPAIPLNFVANRSFVSKFGQIPGIGVRRPPPLLPRLRPIFPKLPKLFPAPVLSRSAELPPILSPAPHTAEITVSEATKATSTVTESAAEVTVLPLEISLPVEKNDEDKTPLEPEKSPEKPEATLPPLRIVFAADKTTLVIKSSNLTPSTPSDKPSTSKPKDGWGGQPIPIGPVLTSKALERFKIPKLTLQGSLTPMTVPKLKIEKPLELAAESQWQPAEKDNPLGLKENDMVWAKMPREPYWPAEIFSFNPGSEACVLWLGSSQHGFVQISTLERFQLTFKRRYNPKRATRNYQKAVVMGILKMHENGYRDDSYYQNLSPAAVKLLAKSSQKMPTARSAKKSSKRSKSKKRSKKDKWETSAFLETAAVTESPIQDSETSVSSSTADAEELDETSPPKLDISRGIEIELCDSDSEGELRIVEDAEDEEDSNSGVSNGGAKDTGEEKDFENVLSSLKAINQLCSGGGTSGGGSETNSSVLAH